MIRGYAEAMVTPIPGSASTQYTDEKPASKEEELELLARPVQDEASSRWATSSNARTLS
ncbi:hypothetical protein WMF30_01580 [Sorangium sp. So ce134]